MTPGGWRKKIKMLLVGTRKSLDSYNDNGNGKGVVIFQGYVQEADELGMEV